MQHAARRLRGARRAVRVPRRVRAPDARPAVPLRGGGARAAGSAASSRAPAARRTCPACWPPRPPSRCFGVPVPSKHLQGLDSLLSIVQMPAGIPVATFAIGAAGAQNAALCAAAVLALSDSELAQRLDRLPRGADPSRARPHSCRESARDPARRHRRRAGRRPARTDVRAAGARHGLPRRRCSIPIPVAPRAPRPTCTSAPPTRTLPRSTALASDVRRRHHRVRERPGGGARAARAHRAGCARR